MGEQSELSREPDVISGTYHRGFEDSVNTKFPGDLRRGFCGAFVMHNRFARDDLDCIYLSETGDQRVRHSIRKKFLCRVTREILDRKHHDRVDARGPTAREKALP